MRNVPSVCVKETTDSRITFCEKRSVIHFLNPKRYEYKRVAVDGCAIKSGLKCDNLLTNQDEKEERFVELKGTDIPHGIDQLRASIQLLGEYSEGRKAYLVFTACSTAAQTKIQIAKIEFKRRFNAELIAQRTPVEEKLY